MKIEQNKSKFVMSFVNFLYSPQRTGKCKEHNLRRYKIIELVLFMLLAAFYACKSEKAEAYIKSGNEKVKQMRFEEAIGEFDKAISAEADNAEAYYLRANAKNNLRDAEGAIKDYSKAIELKPQYADAYYNRGNAKFYLGDRDGACADWIMADAQGKANIKDKIKGCSPATH